jgi:hypothetical protein
MKYQLQNGTSLLISLLPNSGYNYAVAVVTSTSDPPMFDKPAANLITFLESTVSAVKLPMTAVSFQSCCWNGWRIERIPAMALPQGWYSNKFFKRIQIAQLTLYLG